jgi:hypothetical protein
VVIFEAGGGAFSKDWKAVQSFERLCHPQLINHHRQVFFLYEKNALVDLGGDVAASSASQRFSLRS